MHDLFLYFFLKQFPFSPRKLYFSSTQIQWLVIYPSDNTQAYRGRSNSDKHKYPSVERAQL